MRVTSTFLDFSNYPPVTKPITRENIDEYLDNGKLYVCYTNGKWYKIRRNGKTRKWKTQTMRIYIPFTAKFRDYSAIDESDFVLSTNMGNAPNALENVQYRHIDDIPKQFVV